MRIFLTQIQFVDSFMENSLTQLLIDESLRHPDWVLGGVLLTLTLLVTALLMVRSKRARAKDSTLLRSMTNEPHFGNAGNHQNMFSSAIPKPQGISAGRTSMNELIDIEEALLALRELHHRKLITAEVYVEESMKQSTRLQG